MDQSLAIIIVIVAVLIRLCAGGAYRARPRKTCCPHDCPCRCASKSGRVCKCKPCRCGSFRSYVSEREN